MRGRGETGVADDATTQGAPLPAEVGGAAVREVVDGRARPCGRQNFAVDSPVDLGTHEDSAKLSICAQERMGAGNCEAFVNDATGAD